MTLGEVQAQTLYYQPAAAVGMPERPFVLTVNGLLRELIVEAISEDARSGYSGRFQVLVGLIGSEVKRASDEGVKLPVGEHPGLSSVMDRILDSLAEDRSIESYARAGGMSARTLRRLFAREVGMSFSGWRELARMARALEELGAGRQVKEVAGYVGYDSVSAFVTAFKRALGKTPGEYFSEEEMPGS